MFSNRVFENVNSIPLIDGHCTVSSVLLWACLFSYLQEKLCGGHVIRPVSVSPHCFGHDCHIAIWLSPATSFFLGMVGARPSSGSERPLARSFRYRLLFWSIAVGIVWLPTHSLAVFGSGLIGRALHLLQTRLTSSPYSGRSR